MNSAIKTIQHWVSNLNINIKLKFIEKVLSVTSLLTAANLSNLAKSSFNILTSSCAVHLVAKTVINNNFVIQ